MPLFIDLHVDPSLTPDLVKQCHCADKEIQAKYSVRYLQILLNQPQGYLFCLMEGPDKEACAKVHQEAHGMIACNILEITEADFGALLANKNKDGQDFTVNLDGTIDTGIRTLLAVDLLGSNDSCRAAKELIAAVLHQYEGRSSESLENQLIAVFDTCNAAVDAALTICKQIGKNNILLEIRMGIDMGPPLNEVGSFFEEARKSAMRLSFISLNGQIAMPAKVKQLYTTNNVSTDSIKVVGRVEEKFLGQLMTCAEKVWDNHEVTVTEFAHELGISKSQLARKLKSIINLSPNDFLKEFRLRKAIQMLEDQSMNVAEVTMAIGFTNPSYFTKCFRERFGKVPSDFSTVT